MTFSLDPGLKTCSYTKTSTAPIFSGAKKLKESQQKCVDRGLLGRHVLWFHCIEDLSDGFYSTTGMFFFTHPNTATNYKHISCGAPVRNLKTYHDLSIESIVPIQILGAPQ